MGKSTHHARKIRASLVKDLKRVIAKKLARDEYDWHAMQGSYESVSSEEIRLRTKRRVDKMSDVQILSLAVQEGHVDYGTLADRKVFSLTDDE